jgi:WD40 repeat protein
VHFLDINAAGRPGYGGGVGITVRRSLYFPAGAYAAAFSPDGRKIIVVGDYEALFLDARSHRPIGGPLQLLVYEREVAWSPNSRAVAIGTRWDGPIGGGAVAVFDAQTGTRIWGSAAAFGLAWSPDGSAIAFGGDGSSGTQVRRASDGGPISGGWHDHVIPSSLAFTPDGRILAEAGFDGRVVLRDVATGTQIGPPLVTSFNQTAYVTFDPSGTLIVGTRDGGLWRWDISVRGMLREACLIAGRNLSYREWADLHTGRPYAKACP